MCLERLGLGEWFLFLFRPVLPVLIQAALGLGAPRDPAGVSTTHQRPVALGPGGGGGAKSN